MPPPLTLDTETAIESLLANVSAPLTRHASWRITGPRTVGKTACLEALARRLSGSRDLHPILVSPPVREWDTGLVALAQIADGLKRNGLANGDVSSLLLRATPWRDKLADTRVKLQENAETVVLLVDYSTPWSRQSDEPDVSHFSRLADEIVYLLRDQIPCRRVHTAWNAAWAVGGDLRLRPSSPAEDVLNSAERWGSLAGHAASLWRSFGEDLNQLTPLNLRLLVALQTVSGRGIDNLPDPAQLPRQVAERVLTELHLRQLWDVWIRLSLLREPFPEEILDRAGVRNLSQTSSDLLHCLIEHRDGQFTMHETVRHAARVFAPEFAGADSRQAHLWYSEVVDYYCKKLAPGVGTPLHMLERMAAFFYASEAADPRAVQKFGVFFSDQLNGLGRRLSISKKYDSAVEVFERSVKWDAEDDYAHHYLAYNLDIQGKDRKFVSDHYHRAVELSPGSVWWWSRWICFMITLARTADAEHQWDEALAQLGTSDDPSDVSVYFDLHAWLARLLLHRGQLDFARRVLDAIPQAAINADESGRLVAMKMHLRVLLEARRQRSVFPASIAPEDWWGKGPHLNSWRDHAGRKLTDWRPGRVESVSETEIDLLLAGAPAEGMDSPSLETLTLSFEEFNRYSRDERAEQLTAGRFVEIATYDGVSDPVVRVHKDAPLHLPPVFPDPARYIKHRWKVVDADKP